MKQKIKKLQQMREEKNSGGGTERIKKRKKSGKLTARERIDYFFDGLGISVISLKYFHSSSGFKSFISFINSRLAEGVLELCFAK